jgi:uncharacterized protein (DUF2336 family)
MIVRRFLDWSRSANAAARAEAASALARAWLHSDLDPGQRDEALAALTCLLDDSAPMVRRALAEAFAGAAEAPPYIVVALANDQSDVAAPVLARSPILCDADLIDCVAVGDQTTHVAVACRADISASIAGALAEMAGPGALIAVVRNRGAAIPEFAYRRMIERHGESGELREAILARRDLPAGVRHMLVVAVSDALSRFVQNCAWMQPDRGRRLVAEACDAAAVAIADTPDESGALVRHLRDTGQLTAGLVLRALLSGRIAFVEAAFADLADLPARRVAAILVDRRDAGFAALYRRAGLPPTLLAAFAAALAAWRDLAGRSGDPAATPALSRRMIERTLTAIGDGAAPENARLFALLRRFEAEAARDEARAFVADLMQETPQIAAPEKAETAAQQATDAVAPILAQQEVLDPLDAELRAIVEREVAALAA